MMAVDDIGVAVAGTGVPVRMTVRFRAFPTFVLVLVMFVVMGVQMAMAHVVVLVPQLARVGCRP